MTTDPTRWTADEVGERAVLFVADESDGVAHDDFDAWSRRCPATTSLVADLSDVDVALRAAADAESPSAHELRRTREASLQLVRTCGAALIAAAASRQPARRSLPRWAFVAAAASLAVVGVAGWISSSDPGNLPAKSMSAEVAQRNAREQGSDDGRDYSELVPAFINPAEARASDDVSAVPDSLDDGDVQVDALNVLSTTAQD